MRILGSNCQRLCDVEPYAAEWRARKDKKSGGYMYIDGNMFCRVCKIYVKKGKAVGRYGNRCPCCNSLMSTTRRVGLATVLKKKGIFAEDPRYIKAIE